MRTPAFLVWTSIGLGFAILQPAQAAPPFAGTLWLDSDIIKDSDPTAFKTLVANGQASRWMYDNRVGSWLSVNAFQFNASFDDGLKLEVLVNPEFGDAAAALVQATKYAPLLGRMPACIRTQLKTFSINAGDAYFAYGSNDLMIHTAKADGYGVWLEEALLYEAGHALDAAHATSAGWVAAQTTDPEYISDWAKLYPLEQDITESFMAYLAARHRADRVTPEMAATIVATIPNRIAYFDGLKLDLYPIVQPDPLAITSFTYDRATATLTLVWVSRPGGIYAVDVSTDLMSWDGFASNIASQGYSTTFTQTNVPAQDRAFFKVSELAQP